ncbi:MAG: cation-transporting P-type ATPase [Steroidobacteraceae bacterium]|jgi:magnesium-transporting ATPase (P-type)|nr:cation-transporting P-type ATPase [Steroidobacteraceae bacterium]
MASAAPTPDVVHGPTSPAHAAPVDDVFRELGTRADGLSPAEAAERRARFGANRLPAAPRRSLWSRFLQQFRNLFIYVLLASAVVSLLLGHAVDALVILAVVVLNALIGFVQEGRAEQAMDSIRAMIDPRASVLRDGRRCTVPAEDIVPGDVVLLEAGDRVPADLRLFRLRNLRIAEAALTGESVAVEKAPEAVPPDTALGDRRSMAYSGTLVTGGQGAGVAVATGGATELGRISRLLESVHTLETPLTRQMDRFARGLTLVVAIACAAVFAWAVLRQGYAPREAFMVVVGIAVSAIPEGLPAILTITLAIGVARMARRSAIVRRLPAVETLGSVSVICSDKTGTLTRNEMMVTDVVVAGAACEVTGAGYAPTGQLLHEGREVDPSAHPALAALARAAVLCNDAGLRQAGGRWSVDGDPMEGALLAFGIKAGHEADALRRALPRDDEIPFDAAHRFMATLHHSHAAGSFVLVKGAPERVLAMCSVQQSAGALEPLDREAWLGRVAALAAEGRRVLGFATREMPAGTGALRFADLEGGAAFLGVVGIIDPPREEAIAAVGDCRAAGIRVVMITGDHAGTAQAIARELGLGAAPRVAEGAQVEGCDAAALQRLARDVDVFARTSPEHKLRLVEALQKQGAVVAMTGDGVNDAPALKRADVGVAMGGKGTEAAKEAAEIVLADDNFASIVAAVREGRTVYDNIVKVIGWTLPTNGGEAFAIITAIAFGLALPITPLQILWINMVTAVALGLTLAFEPTEPATMQRPPRAAGEPLLSRYLVWRIVLVSALMVAGVFAVFYWAQARGATLEYARSMAVNAIVAMEVFYLFSVRYVHGSSLTLRGLLGTRAVLAGVSLVAMAQLVLTYWPPMQRVFGMAALSFGDGCAIVGVGVALLFVVELEKRVARRGA